jgi:hypothetical protein
VASASMVSVDGTVTGAPVATQGKQRVGWSDAVVPLTEGVRDTGPHISRGSNG